MADVILEIEVRVVDPQRTARLQRRRGELLAVPRNQVKATPDVPEIVRERGRGPREHQQSPDVHMRRRPLLVQERGIDRGQAVEMLLGHSRFP